MSTSDIILRARNVQKHFGALVALDGVDLDVKSGEVVAIIGPSGSGKSTLVRCIHQLEPINGGALYLGDDLLGVKRKGNALERLGDRELSRQRARMGMVFQQFNLFGHYTVLENLIEGPVQVLGVPKSEAVARAKSLLEQVRLSDKIDAYPRQLSGGQQQRVAIARALANQPELMLFDEPTSALDPELVGEVLDVIRKVADSGTTMIIVTHEMNFARDVADRIVFMDKGKIVAQGRPEEIFASRADTRLGAFLSSTGLATVET
jgi:polar amino acid transport system ATP-binding protein